MVGAMTHNNDNTLNIIFKCSDDKSEHEKIKDQSQFRSCELMHRKVENWRSSKGASEVVGDRRQERRAEKPETSIMTSGTTSGRKELFTLLLLFVCALCTKYDLKFVLTLLFTKYNKLSLALYLHNLFWLTLLCEWYNQRSFIKFIKDQIWVSSKRAKAASPKCAVLC